MSQRTNQAGADAYRDWLQNGVRSRPVASPLFRLLAGLLATLFLATFGYTLWRWVNGQAELPSSDWTDVTAFVAMAVMFLMFGTVAWFGSLPVWMWRLFAHMHGGDADAGAGAQGAQGAQGGAAQRWLQEGMAAPPTARPAFRVLAGLVTGLFLLLACTWLLRLANGEVALPDIGLFDVPWLLAFGLLLCLFGVVAVTGRAPLWVWRAYLRMSGRV